MQFSFSWLPLRPIRITFETLYPDKILSEFQYGDDIIRKTKMCSKFFFQYILDKKETSYAFRGMFFI